MALVEGPNGVVGAWDTDGQIYFGKIKPGTTEIVNLQSAPGAGSERKHPALAVSAQGETILVWTEGASWQRSGALAWQVFDDAGKPIHEGGRVDGGIPVWGLPTVVATEAGFAIIH